MRVRRTAKIIMRNTFGLLAFSATATTTSTAQREAPQQAVKNVNKRNLNASRCQGQGRGGAGGGGSMVASPYWAWSLTQSVTRSIGPLVHRLAPGFLCVQLIFDG